MPLSFSALKWIKVQISVVSTIYRDLTVPVILLPLRPVSLTHKNSQRYKIICGMHPKGCKGQLIDLTMFL